MIKQKNFDLAPVIVFAYARPDHLRHTLESLAAAYCAEESDLWVFSDGARDNADVGRVAEVRSLLAEPGWQKAFGSVKVTASSDNKGLAASIISGVGHVLQHHDRVIVVEDDLVVADDFLRFMNDALEYYRNHSSIGSITAYCPLKEPPPGYDYDVMLVPRSCSHSWGTWRDRWTKVDWTGVGAARVWKDQGLRQRFVATGTDKLDRLRRRLKGGSDTWSIIFNLWHTLEGRTTVYPVRNRIRNIGYDGSGENTRLGDKMHTKIFDGAFPYKLSIPPEDPRVLAAFRHIYSGPMLVRMMSSIRNLITPNFKVE